MDLAFGCPFGWSFGWSFGSPKSFFRYFSDSIGKVLVPSKRGLPTQKKNMFQSQLQNSSYQKH